MLNKLYPCTEFEEVVYLLQGGGALGAFQVGVYQALDEVGMDPDWLIGISIGAINAAIIAGNPPELRLKSLQQFWDLITHKIEPKFANLYSQNLNLIQAYNMCSALYALSFGQSGFFNLSALHPHLIYNSTPDKISYYQTHALRQSLNTLIDFEYLNQAHVRLSLGAVDIATGKLKFFDNTETELTVEHIMASCALPPGFPAVEIAGDFYWDGGLYSNTPLIKVINDLPHKNRLCFLIDLFDSTGLVPSNMDEVLERAKDINYAGHLDLMLDFYEAHLLLQRKIAECVAHLPTKMQDDPYFENIARLGDAHNVHITKIVYKAHKEDLHSKDYEFSNFNARRRMQEGYTHTKHLLADPEWWLKREENFGSIVHPSAEDMHIVVGNCACKKS